MQYRLIVFFLTVASVSDDEWNLLYVAITRAKRTLYVTKTVSNILTLTGVSYYCLFSFLSKELSRCHNVSINSVHFLYVAGVLPEVRVDQQAAKYRPVTRLLNCRM